MDADGIYLSPLTVQGQEQEVELRRSVAEHAPVDVLKEVSVHHSIPVMDNEVQRFLSRIPKNGSIIDVGGCWGWHWRHLAKDRPDVHVVIVELVRENLLKAKEFLGPLIGTQVTLVCGNATCLPFPDSTFAGYWSVQTLQHIERFEVAVSEAWRVLRPGGKFVSYSLNIQPPIFFLYRVLAKTYHVRGMVDGRYFLERGSKDQLDAVAKIFGSSALERYTEVLFKPEVNWHGPGSLGSVVGRIDTKFSGSNLLARLFGRQISFHCEKQL